MGGSEFARAVLRETGWERREVFRRARQETGYGELGEGVAHVAGIMVGELCSGVRRPPVVAARRALAQVATSELERSGAAVARYLGVATSTANRAVGGALDPLAQRLLGTPTDC